MFENLRKLQDIDVAQKTVVVRTNFDVPIKDGEVADSTRVQAAVETIQYLIEKECKVVLISHMGRPNGDRDDQFSLMPVRFELGKLLNTSIKFAHLDACENSIKFMEPGEILLIENLRFFEEEKSDDLESAKKFFAPLLELADIYVNDNFGLYRNHASVFALPQIMPSVAGFAIQHEIEALSQLKNDTESPFVAIIGGAKTDTKVPIIKSLIDDVDTIIIGGAIAYTFLKASGVNVGDSKIEKSKLEEAKEILDLAKKHNVDVRLPIDHITAKEFSEDADPLEVETQQIPNGKIGMDIGPKTLEMYREIIEGAKTIMWNGPMGVFEFEQFATGTESVGQFIALSAPRSAFKVAGGAETTMAINNLRIRQKRFNHISSGGGMMAEFIASDTEDQFEVLQVLTGKQSL